jgi:uncharacterized protein GlcG (DUF336 family)
MAQPFSKRTISSETAHQIVSASEARAAEMAKPFTIAVVDDGGALETAVAAGMDTDRWLS